MFRILEYFNHFSSLQMKAYLTGHERVDIGCILIDFCMPGAEVLFFMGYIMVMYYSID